MRSIFGECSGNVRSTPTPKDCLRTVKVSRAPLPWRLIATPSNTWVRRRVPSITRKWTRSAIARLEARNPAQLGALDGVDDGAHGKKKAQRQVHAGARGES